MSDLSSMSTEALRSLLADLERRASQGYDEALAKRIGQVIAELSRRGE